MSNTQIDRTWIYRINSSIELYPIQFANCDRLQKNDAVYIFDEVGSGKTISSGLMALDYLVNNPNENVGVITTNALTKKRAKSNLELEYELESETESEYGQFLKDWYGYLPFETMGLKNRVTVINNHYSNIKRLSENELGLLIIDEAQLFLNDLSLRNKYLRKIRAKKIVFLTATPIKTGKDDLYTYVSIARAVLCNPNLSDAWIEEIGTEGKNVDSIISSQFDCEYPVTRYFKDTIMSINVEGYVKNQARRLIPQLWDYDYSGNENTSKDFVLLNHINKILSESEDSRFIVFTRFVEKEANAIGEFLHSQGFVQHVYGSDENQKTYKIVTGENSSELSRYSKRSNLPTVLILTYQIAEQGVNLPGYNYVINYHISAFPSALEQRFGRIDRMGKHGSVFQEINMCFLISKGYWDSNTWNFYSAMSVYIRSLLAYLPSKNTILSEEVVKRYIDQKANIESYVKKIKDLIEDEHQIESILNYMDEKNNEDTDAQDTDAQDTDAQDYSGYEFDKDLYAFIDENAIEIDDILLESDKEKAIAQFKADIVGRLDEYHAAFNNGELSDSQIIEMIKSIGDKVFYRSDGEIHTVDAIGECGKYITENAQFIKYKETFSQNVKVPLIISKYRDIFEKYFENRFVENDFNSLFPYEGYSRIVDRILTGHDEIVKEDKELLINKSMYLVKSLPIWVMCNVYRYIIQNIPGRIRWNYNQFQSAFYQLYIRVRRTENHLGLSDDFYQKYFSEDVEYVDWYDDDYNVHHSTNIYVNSKNYYKIDIDKDGVLQASNWYKLAYYCARKEEGYLDSKNNWYTGDGNVYCVKERLIEYLVSNYEAYKEALNNCEAEQVELVRKYEKCRDELKKTIQKISEISYSQSRFNYYYFTDSGLPRKYSFGMPYITDGKVYIYDMWTQGIIYELYGQRYNKCMLGNMYPHIEALKEVYTCY